jgi:ATP phosphoribosyltransferase regulatory subunit
MIPSTPWQLPDYIEDVLPGEAVVLEYLRRRCLDTLSSYGYAWVHPPMIENLDTLLTGTGQDLNPLTFKVVDQRSGKTLGLRADITPQVARIDAHLFSHLPLNRLCYCGSVLHTHPSPLHDSREIWQLGAELYGSSHRAADHEMMTLALTLLKQAGLKNTVLVLGHVELFEALTAELDEGIKKALFNALQLKDTPALIELTATLDVATQEALLKLPRLYGEVNTVIHEAKAAVKHFPRALHVIHQIEHLLSLSAAWGEDVQIRLDLGELPSYEYHTGLVFSVYVAGQNRPMVWGGRYDRLGAARGQSRSATGFSLDLRTLAEHVVEPLRGMIAAPYLPNDEALAALIQELRSTGHSVWVELPADQLDEGVEHIERECVSLPMTHVLTQQEGQWGVVKIA